MESNAGTPRGFRALLRWAMTPPQSVAVYFVGLVLVLGLSFYAGTLKPKKPPPSMPASTTSTPHN